MRQRLAAPILAIVAAVGISGCGFDALDLPLPGGADLGSDPYDVTIEFRDVLDLVPQSAVRVNDIAVGRVTGIELDDWNARVTVRINGDAELPANAEATIRQSSLLGEKFVSLDAPATGATGTLADGDEIPLERSGRNPEVEEVLGAASLLFNGGGLEKTNLIVRELNDALGGNNAEIKELLVNTSDFLGQLDDNSAVIIETLEKVNRLSLTANDQRAAITGALDELPEALRVLEDQREQLVALTASLERLGDTATGVIQDSRVDTIENLKALEPVLRNLTLAGDDLVNNVSTFLTFPFPDNAVGGSLAAAQAPCDTSTPVAQTSRGCGGDYLNLAINIDISEDQLLNILGFQGASLGNAVPAGEGLDLLGELDGLGGAGELEELDGELAFARQLREIIEGLAPESGSLPVPAAPAAPAPGGATPAPAAPQPQSGTPSLLQLPGLCSLFGSCRPAPVSTGDSDLAGLLVRPVVAP